MLDRALPAIVVIRVNYVKPFDGEQAGSAHATGFVVDFDRGLILTNRHVIGTGPIRAEATFVSKEEVPLTPVYRDPVHDFGFFQFDASALRYGAELRRACIPLAPAAAKVGLEIRVVGNDAGEKVSILGGTLARLDRNAPHYGGDGFNDFNTFYLSAASNTSGGSSGSPVLDVQGRAVALNAGGSNQSSQSYYLPLHGVVRALDALKRSTTPPRGTLRVVWRHLTCDEARRLGLAEATEAALRRHHARFRDADVSTGVLAVEQVVRGGEGEAAGLEPGDLLLEAGGAFPDFDDLEAFLDARNAAGGAVTLAVERGGATLAIEAARAECLHGLTPSRFLEFGGGVLHGLSLGAARNGNLDPSAGVYVAFAGFVLDAAGVPAHAVVTHLDDRPTPTLDDLEAVAKTLGDGARVTLRFYNIGDQYNDQVALVRVNWRWFDLLRWTRRDPPLKEVLDKCAAGTCDARYRACWSSEKVPTSGVAEEDVSTSAVFQRSHKSAAANGAVASLCKVSFDVLHAIDGVHDWHFVGCGVVVDAALGLVAVDRNTVVTSLGECAVSFAAAVELPARVVFAHPTHNFAIVRYDPARFEGAPDDARPKTADLAATPLAIGDALEFVGLCRTNPDQSLSQKVQVTELSCVNIAQAHVPRFRALNEEIAKFDQVLNKSLGGVLVDAGGRVVASWSCYSFYSWSDEKNYEAFHAVGVDALVDATAAVAAALGDGADTALHAVGFGLKRLPLSTARTSMKLDDAWVAKLRAARPDRSQVLTVAQLSHAGTDDDGDDGGPVREGDLLLAVDGKPTATFADVDAAARGRATVTATLWREGAALERVVATERVPVGAGTERVVVWCGLLLQAPHRAVLEMGAPQTGVYCSYYLYGSPGHFYAIKACRFVVEVDGKPVSDLDGFVAAVASIGDGDAVRLKTSDLQGQVVASTLKTDYRFWPSHEFAFVENDWTVRPLS